MSGRRHTKNIRPGTGYAWMLENGQICNWAESSKGWAFMESKPSPGAVAIHVRIAPATMWKRRTAGKGARQDD